MYTNIKKIICVDDDPAITDLITQVLESTGSYKVFSFEKGKTALSRLLHVMPDAILLDMMMPEMDGLQLFQTLRGVEAMQHIPIAFLTAETSSKKMEEYRKIGALGVIAKPIDVDALVYQVALLFGHAA